MQLNWKYAESTVRPLSVDTTSSPTTVYLNRNIVENEREYEGETTMWYKFETAALTREEYAEYKADQRMSDIEDVLAEIIGGGEV